MCSEMSPFPDGDPEQVALDRWDQTGHWRQTTRDLNHFYESPFRSVLLNAA